MESASISCRSTTTCGNHSRYSAERPRTLRGTTEIDLRDGHFALAVADFERAVADLRTAGVECVERPDNITPWKQVYVTDPDGNVIELNAAR